MDNHLIIRDSIFFQEYLLCFWHAVYRGASYQNPVGTTVPRGAISVFLRAHLFLVDPLLGSSFLRSQMKSWGCYQDRMAYLGKALSGTKTLRLPKTLLSFSTSQI